MRSSLRWSIGYILDIAHFFASGNGEHNPGFPRCGAFRAKSGNSQANQDELVTPIFCWVETATNAMTSWKSSSQFCDFRDNKNGSIFEQEMKVNLAVKCEAWSIVNLQQQNIKPHFEKGTQEENWY